MFGIKIVSYCRHKNKYDDTDIWKCAFSQRTIDNGLTARGLLLAYIFKCKADKKFKRAGCV